MDLENVDNSKLWIFIKDYIFHLLKLRKSELKVFDEDPIEYIRSRSDPLSKLSIVRSNAADLIDELCNLSLGINKNKKVLRTSNMLKYVMTHIHNLLK